MALGNSLQQQSTNIGRLFHELARRVRDVSDLRALGDYERQRMAAELGVTTAQLENLVAVGPQASAEIERMMAAMGIDSSKVQATFPALMREMRIACGQCEAKKTCRYALADGTAAALMHSFCPNAEELKEVASRRGVQAA